MYKTLILIVFLALVCSCSNNKKIENESLILTVGNGMNLEEPRFGIEIKGDTLFYCEETEPEKTPKDEYIYKYYYCLIGEDKVNKIIQRCKAAFDAKLDYGHIPDASYYQININTPAINTPADSLRTTFYETGLDSQDKVKLIEDIIALKNCNLKPLQFHAFPGDVLQNKLPPPPPVSVNKAPSSIK